MSNCKTVHVTIGNQSNLELLKQMHENVDVTLSNIQELWPIASRLCKMAKAEGWQASDAIKQIVRRKPADVDPEYPSLRDGQEAEEKYLQKRAKIVQTLKAEIQQLYFQTTVSSEAK